MGPAIRFRCPLHCGKVVTLKRRCDGFGRAIEDSCERAYLKPRFNIHYAQKKGNVPLENTVYEKIEIPISH